MALTPIQRLQTSTVVTYLRAREFDHESVVHEVIILDVSRTHNAVRVLPESCNVFLWDQLTLGGNMTDVKNNYESVDISAAMRIDDEGK